MKVELIVLGSTMPLVDFLAENGFKAISEDIGEQLDYETGQCG